MISTCTQDSECRLPVPSSTVIVSGFYIGTERNWHSNELYGFRAKMSASVEAFLLTIVKNKHRSSMPDSLLISTYGGLFFFLSAALSGLILEKRSGDNSNRWRYGSSGSWIWVMRHCKCSVSTIGHVPSPADRRRDFRDRGYHIRDRASDFIRLAGGVTPRQRCTLSHHGLRGAIFGISRTVSVTKLTRRLISIASSYCNTIRGRRDGDEHLLRYCHSTHHVYYI
jgi:hypothetical protein